MNTTPKGQAIVVWQLLPCKSVRYSYKHNNLEKHTSLCDPLQSSRMQPAGTTQLPEHGPMDDGEQQEDLRRFQMLCAANFFLSLRAVLR
jgi:hypothetical protein